MLAASDQDTLTKFSPGSDCGAWLRSFWFPTAISDRWEGQRRVAVHAAEGRDPPNTFRDRETNSMIETSCWNTVTAPGETEAAE